MMLAAGAPRAVGREQRCTQPARSRSRSRALPATCHAHKASSSQPSALSMRGGVAGALAALLQGREQSSSGSAAPPPDVDNGELPSKRVLRVRSLFLSDIHLVRRGHCQLHDTFETARPHGGLGRCRHCDARYLGWRCIAAGLAVTPGCQGVRAARWGLGARQVAFSDPSHASHAEHLRRAAHTACLFVPRAPPGVKLSRCWSYCGRCSATRCTWCGAHVPAGHSAAAAC